MPEDNQRATLVEHETIHFKQRIHEMEVTIEDEQAKTKDLTNLAKAQADDRIKGYQSRLASYQEALAKLTKSK